MATLLRKPALLARDVAAMRDLSGARFELGLGAGYVREEFEAAELPFPSARQRVEYLQHVMEFLRRHVPDVPILIAGSGDRLLTVAARQARLRSGPPPSPAGPEYPGPAGLSVFRPVGACRVRSLAALAGPLAVLAF